MRLVIFSLLLLISVTIIAQNITAEVEEVSDRVQQMVSYARERTVAVKVIIENKAGFGSGAIISADGLVLTCAHVAEVGKVLTIITADGEQYQATSLGMNSLNDYAVLHIEGVKEFPYYELGDSSSLQLLQWVVAVGHPGGPYPDSQPVLVPGRIRGLHKRLPVEFGIKFYDDAILTDVPIFAGNSGGPLLDLQGRLIGINGAITLINDLAFAIPIDEIIKDLPALKKGENIAGRGIGGIWEILEIIEEMQEDIPPEDIYKLFKDTPIEKLLKLLGEELEPLPPTKPELGLRLKEKREGQRVVAIEIAEVKPNSLAQIAGFKKGDSIVAFNGGEVRSVSRLKNILATVEKGERVCFEVKRGEELREIWVIFDRQAYSRNSALHRAFGDQGLHLKEVTVRVHADGQHAGYGVIISSEGLVLTNYQILRDAGRVTVQLQDPSETMYLAKVVGENGIWDVALLKFQPEEELRAIAIGDDRDLKIGQWVISGGCESGAIQVGMVSALDRYVPPDRKIPIFLLGLLGRPIKSAVRAYQEVIQHDSAIEGDQFGTPLVNAGGELVGINCGHFYRGTTYAVPISAIEEILPQLKAGEYVAVPKEFEPYEPQVDTISKVFEYLLEPEKKSLEEVLEDIDRLFSEEVEEKGGFLGVEVRQHWRGVEVVKVLEGYPAAASGIKPGDIIIEIGKQKIHSLVSLLEILKHTPPGTEVKVVVLRHTDQWLEKEFQIVLAERPSED